MSRAVTQRVDALDIARGVSIVSPEPPRPITPAHHANCVERRRRPVPARRVHLVPARHQYPSRQLHDRPDQVGRVWRPAARRRHRCAGRLEPAPSMSRMRRLVVAAVRLSCAACRHEASPPSGNYLFVWAGDSAGTSSDFLGVIDASPSSPTYGAIVASVPTGVAGTHPHHTEAVLAANSHLLANGFHAGRTWLYDLSEPRTPKILTSFGDLGGFSHPHTYVRLPNEHVLATFQYKGDSATTATPSHAHGASPTDAPHTTGGLVEMDERGTVIRSVSASDSAIPDHYIYPYSVLPIPGLDRALSTTSDMDEADKKATSQWVQLWRLSDLTLLRTIALPPGPRGDEHEFTGEPLLLADGKSAYVHTFNCGLYLVRGIDADKPSATFVKGFEGKNCGVPVLAGHYWLQTVPDAHALVSLDIADPEHPREVSR